MTDTDTSMILGGLGVAGSVLTIIFGAINHKRVRSSCCGKKMEASFAVDSMTPSTAHAEPPPKIVATKPDEIVVE